jgi:ABC-type lipopolysaccharide export system ATPase subunit
MLGGSAVAELHAQELDAAGDRVRTVVDRVYIIDHGTVVFEGTPKRLRADTQVTATYLGVGN